MSETQESHVRHALSGIISVLEPGVKGWVGVDEKSLQFRQWGRAAGGIRGENGNGDNEMAEVVECCD